MQCNTTQSTLLGGLKLSAGFQSLFEQPTSKFFVHINYWWARISHTLARTRRMRARFITRHFSHSSMANNTAYLSCEPADQSARDTLPDSPQSSIMMACEGQWQVTICSHFMVYKILIYGPFWMQSPYLFVVVSALGFGRSKGYRPVRFTHWDWHTHTHDCLSLRQCILIVWTGSRRVSSSEPVGCPNPCGKI